MADEHSSLMAAEEENGEDSEGVSTLAEYMEQVEAQELEADLVLGGDDGKECTYKQGYLKRQAVFSCLTCTPGGGAGFCTACSFACHDGHDVVELWTRRHFRCDCGNSKYGQAICKLQADKDIENAANVYNQNYKGVYCTCHRVYPDPEGAALGEMLQCCICEDWFHEMHLGLPPSLQIPRDEEGEPTFDELICNACVPLVCPFLFKYPGVVISPAATGPDVPTVDAVETVDQQTNGSGGVGNDKPEPSLEATADPKADNSSAHENGQVVDQVNAGAKVCDHVLNDSAEEERLVKQQETQSVNGSSSRETVADEGATNGHHHCELEKEQGSEAANIQPGQPVFLIKSWRAQLCRCPNCLKMYEENGVAFLLDADDSLQAYEASAKRKREETRAQFDGSALMQGLGHVQQIELLHGFNDLTAQLKNFLAPFGETGRTVTSADIHDFFADLNQKKRRHN